MEFVSIKPTDAFAISRSAENFVKNIKISNIDDEGDLVEEQIDLKDVKRNAGAIQKKLEKNREGYTFIILAMIIGMIVCELYFDIQFILLKDHQTNMNKIIVLLDSDI